MSVGTRILTGYGPLAGLAALSEARELLPRGSLVRRLLPEVGAARACAPLCWVPRSPPTLSADRLGA